MQSLLLDSVNFDGFFCADAAPFFGFMGVSSALVFANLGAAYGTAKSGVGISSMGVMNPEAVMKNIIPVVMAGVLGIYGLIISVILIQGSQSPLCHVAMRRHCMQLLHTHCTHMYSRICMLCVRVCAGV